MKQSYYKKVDEKIIKEQYKTIEKAIKKGSEDGFISKKVAKHLLAPLPSGASLYMLPKVHKKYNRIPKGRPIIASGECNTERISWLCDYLAKDLVKDTESFLEDTPRLLRVLDALNKEGELPNTAKPVSLDVRSMYTNTPIEEGIKAFEEALNKEQNRRIPTKFIIKLLILVLESNTFSFNQELWLQMLVTAMGTRVVPTYANVFMARSEKDLLTACPKYLRNKIIFYK